MHNPSALKDYHTHSLGSLTPPQYRKFWDDPEASSISWLALLFAIMGLATFAGIAAGDDPAEEGMTPMDLIQSYRECCVQSLVLSNYTKPGPHTMEALMIYMESEFLLTKDDQVQCYLLVGNAVKLGLRMGLHRDPTKVGGKITPYQAEMRRRIWHHLLQIDLLCSFQIGLPGTADCIDSDTQYPGNLLDEDFNEDSLTPPLSRPESEITPMSYTIGKSRVAKVSRKISFLANSITLPSYSEVMHIDKLLHEAHSQVPAPFHLGSEPSFSITDSSERTIKRLSIALLFHKSRCMLHRKFLLKENEHPEFAYSKSAGLEASMALLRCQSMVHEAGLPGGPLSRDRWFLSSLSMHDFLLAAMIVFLSIMRGLTSSSLGPSNSPSREQQKMIEALEKSYKIWKETWTAPSEAKKAAAVLGVMLKKIRLATSHDKGLSNISALSALRACEPTTSKLISSMSLNGKFHRRQVHD
jgi:hypothetical protein